MLFKTFHEMLINFCLIKFLHLYVKASNIFDATKISISLLEWR